MSTNSSSDEIQAMVMSSNGVGGGGVGGEKQKNQDEGEDEDEDDLEVDPITYEPIKDIPAERIFRLRVRNKMRSFDVWGLKRLVRAAQHSGVPPKEPVTRTPLTTFQIKRIMRHPASLPPEQLQEEQHGRENPLDDPLNDFSGEGDYLVEDMEGYWSHMVLVDAFASGKPLAEILTLIQHVGEEHASHAIVGPLCVVYDRADVLQHIISSCDVILKRQLLSMAVRDCRPQVALCCMNSIDMTNAVNLDLVQSLIHVVVSHIHCPVLFGNLLIPRLECFSEPFLDVTLLLAVEYEQLEIVRIMLSRYVPRVVVREAATRTAMQHQNEPLTDAVLTTSRA